jgi:hypothetical protein
VIEGHAARSNSPETTASLPFAAIAPPPPPGQVEIFLLASIGGRFRIDERCVTIEAGDGFRLLPLFHHTATMAATAKAFSCTTARAERPSGTGIVSRAEAVSYRSSSSGQALPADRCPRTVSEA